MQLFPPLTTYNCLLYSGAGNRFLLTHSVVQSDLIPELCQKVQVDGLLWIQSSDVADAKMVIFNNDGSRPSLCGNGLRCTIAHLAQKLDKASISVETDQGIYYGEFVSWDHVFVDMTLPKWEIKPHLLENALPGMPSHIFSANTGVPHVVMKVPNIETIDVEHWGSFLRYHELFTPEGVNANFIQSVTPDLLFVRTYERGLERESLACGTGSLASALIATELFSTQDSIEIQTRSGMRLRIFQRNNGRVYVEGPVQCLSQNCEKFVVD